MFPIWYRPSKFNSPNFGDDITVLKIICDVHRFPYHLLFSDVFRFTQILELNFALLIVLFFTFVVNSSYADIEINSSFFFFDGMS